AERVRALLQAAEQWKELEQIERLEQHVRLVGAAPHRHRELDLPAVRAHLAEQLEQLGELRHAEPVDLRVDAHRDARGAQVTERGERRAERARDAAQPIVCALEAVERNAHALEPRGLRGARPLLVDAAPASRHRDGDAVTRERPHDLRPVVAQIRFTADQRDLTNTEPRHLLDQVETLFGAELVRARVTGTRPAMATGEIAPQRDLPN